MLCNAYAASGVLENLVVLTISKVHIVGILVSNRAVRNFLVTTIADIGSLVQPGAMFLLKIGAGLVAGRAGSTFDATNKDLIADVHFATVVSSYTKVLCIIEGALVIPVGGSTQFHFFGNGSWILAEIFSDVLERTPLI